MVTSMKTLIGIICWCSLSGVAFGGGEQVRAVMGMWGDVAPQDYLLKADFEGTDSVTWTHSSGGGEYSGTYATSPAPLAGAASARVVTTGGWVNECAPISASGTTYAYAMINVSTIGGNDSRALVFTNDSGNSTVVTGIDLQADTTAYKIRMRYSTSDYYAGDGVARNSATTYHIWWDYTPGTGANGKVHYYVSTDGTKPASPSYSVENSDLTITPTYFCMTGNYGYINIYDKIRVSSAPIGSTPQ